jgi:undecaprenyl-diphosphatase
MLKKLEEWDQSLFIYLNNLGLEQYDAFWIFVTQIETWTPLFALFIFLFYRFYSWKAASAIFYFLLITTGITLLATDIVKEFIERLRPNNVEALAELIRVLQRPSNFSFFSGHASSSFAITTFAVLSLRHKTKSIYLAYLWPLIFVTSRIYVGVHYPSDILVGAFVGAFFAYIFYKLCKVELVRLQAIEAPHPAP